MPLVSHALLETWRQRRGDTLTVAGYEAAGGIAFAVAHTAEAVYRRFTAEQADTVREILVRSRPRVVRGLHPGRPPPGHLRRRRSGAWPGDGEGRPRLLRGHRGPVWSVAISADGRRLAIADSRATRSLTAEERSTYSS